MRTVLLLAAAAVALSTGALSAQSAQELPEGVTPSMVSTGETLFKSGGLCFACHGMDAKGLPGVGVNLTDDEWFYGDGEYESLVELILAGVSPEVSKSGVMMPPKGGSQITEEQARAIAGYVWTLSHRAHPVRPGSSWR
jgi:cytochrome c oxidase cbb3-type subunit 3